LSSHTFRIVDLRANLIDPEPIFQIARSPETAVTEALGLDVVRSGSKKDLVARAYWSTDGQATNMVRLYRRIGDVMSSDPKM
jgi:hypothetical protein